MEMVKINSQNIIAYFKDKETIKALISCGTMIALVVLWLQYLFIPVATELQNQSTSENSNLVIMLSLAGFIMLSLLFTMWTLQRALEFIILELVFGLNISGLEAPSDKK